MSYDPTDRLPPFPERSTDVEPGFERFESFLMVDRLKSDYLFGIPLKSALTQETIQDETLTRFIVRATSLVEHELKINITPVKYEDRYDYNLWDYQKYNYIQLNHWPVLQIESVKGKYPNAIDFIQYPKEWISLYGEFGMFQLTPTNGNITQFFLTNDATYIPLLLGSRAQWPQLWQVTYVAGFENDKIPACINDLIGTAAALDALNTLAPVLFPYTGYGIGLDGVSQSIATMGPQWLAARIAELKEKYAHLLDAARSYYNKRILVSAI